MLTPETVRRVHFELSTLCNAACPFCPRYKMDTKGYYKNPYFPEMLADLAMVQRVLDQMPNVGRVLVCGDFGDPMTHPEIVRVVEMVAAVPSKPSINIHTNGGLASPSTWRDLGRLMPRGGLSEVTFSIDGLADTNGIYRRNVRWETVMRNAEAFISAGGRAIWKWIVFDHNRHQLDEARELAAKMGFHAFRHVRNIHPSLEPQLANLPFLREPVTKADPEVSAETIQQWNEAMRIDTPISCVHEQDKEVYVDVKGGLWPCCWIHNGVHMPWEKKRLVHEHFLVDRYEANWNSLAHHDLVAILAHRFWADLTHDVRHNTGLYKCSQTCGSIQPKRTL